MKAILQRVDRAKISVNGDTVNEIGHGLLVLIGIEKTDTIKNAQQMIEKISSIRILSDENNKMNFSVLDKNEEILFVSQFTLCADTQGGNRPSFISAMKQDEARLIYEYCIKALKDQNVKVKQGSFGNYMKIETVLDGPVTIELKS